MHEIISTSRSDWKSCVKNSWEWAVTVVGGRSSSCPPTCPTPPRSDDGNIPKTLGLKIKTYVIVTVLIASASNRPGAMLEMVVWTTQF